MGKFFANLGIAALIFLLVVSIGSCIKDLRAERLEITMNAEGYNDNLMAQMDLCRHLWYDMGVVALFRRGQNVDIKFELGYDCFPIEVCMDCGRMKLSHVTIGTILYERSK